MEEPLIDLKYFQLWHTPEMFAVGITIGVDEWFLNIQIGTLQFIIGRFE